LIKVKGFGLNRSELHTRIGLAEGVNFPRVLGIEATGIVQEAPGSKHLAPGTQVVAMMGGMGRIYDGGMENFGIRLNVCLEQFLGYAEYTCVPASQVIPFKSELPWSTLAAM